MNDFYAALKMLETLQKQIKCQLILTGSHALYLQGVVLSPEKLNDIDIIAVNPTEEDITLFQNLQIISPCYKNVSDYIKANWEVNYQFTVDGIKVDIFIEIRDKEPEIMQYIKCSAVDRLITVQPLMKILAVKKRMNRKKDWKVIKQIAKFVMEGYGNFITNYLDCK